MLSGQTFTLTWCSRWRLWQRAYAVDDV